VVALLLLFQNQIPDTTKEILVIYESMRPQWFSAVWPAARNLFALLALMDFAVAGGRLMLERHSLEEWMAALLQKVMGTLAFFALLIYGVDWMDAIINSFRELGQRGAAVSGISPGEIFLQGLNIAGAIVGSASAWAYITDLAGALAAVLASFVVAISFALIATSYMVVLVESFF
jgi:type IV secretion system protein TrbL